MEIVSKTLNGISIKIHGIQDKNASLTGFKCKLNGIQDKNASIVLK